MGICKVKDLHCRVTKQLAALDGDYINKEQEAWWLLEALSSKDKSFLLSSGVIFLSPKLEETLQEWVFQRVKKRKPLQYILGVVPFCDLQIIVRPPVLIPRFETEEMTSWLIDEINCSGMHGLSILDLCSGSGCIGLALAKAFPSCQVVSLDNGADAVALAHENKVKNGIENIDIRQSDIFDALLPTERFDLIVSNPPYLSEESFSFVSQEIKLWEDYDAFVGGNDGMALYEAIIKQAMLFLNDRQGHIPQLVMEIGVDQDNIEQLLAMGGFKDVRVMYDVAGRRRWVVAAS